MAESNLHPSVELDADLPALVVKIGHYPWHHGGVGAIRSLGRLGVPVFIVTEDRWTPAAASRHTCGRFVWPTSGMEEPEWLVEGLLDIGRRIGCPAMLIPTDDEAAILIAEHRTELADSFLMPAVDRSLPRRLASKRGLRDLCLEHGVPTPQAYFPTSLAELDHVVSQASFPMVVKNLEAFTRRRAPVVQGTTRVQKAGDLYAMAQTWDEDISVILQDHIPHEVAEDWIVQAYCDGSSRALVLFTGRKVRSWPPRSGMTTCAVSVENPALRDISTQFIAKVGFRGVCDLDWRFDRRDGQYKLLDFNPRVGAQFRLFETASGIDVLRAMHLDLSGRRVPISEPMQLRRIVVENFDLPARLLVRSDEQWDATAGVTELAWWASDDPLPFVIMLARIMPIAGLRLWQMARGRIRTALWYWRHDRRSKSMDTTSCGTAQG